MSKTNGERKDPPPSFWSDPIIANADSDLEQQIANALADILEKIQKYCVKGSGWSLDYIILLALHICTFDQLGVGGRSYFPLPAKLLTCAHVINVINHDDFCIAYALLAAKYSDLVVPNDDPRSYEQWFDEVRIDNFEMPLSARDLSRFERVNNIQINVFGWDAQSKMLFPRWISALARRDALAANQRDGGGHDVNLDDAYDLLLFDNEFGNAHFAAITNFDGLMRHLQPNTSRRFFCRRCLSGFRTVAERDLHIVDCSEFAPQRFVYPRPDHNVLKFKEIYMQQKLSHIIYADFECYQDPIERNSDDEDEIDEDDELGAHVRHETEHKPSGYYAYLVGPEGVCVGRSGYSGPDVVDRLFEVLQMWGKVIYDVKKTNLPMNGDPPDDDTCFICARRFSDTDVRVRDHDHYTGDPRGWAHQVCNLNFRNSSKIPVVFHNLRGYDSHLLMQHIGKHARRKLGMIANNMERYLMISMDDFSFIDSFQFLPSSLDTLVSLLAKSNDDDDVKFANLNSQFPDLAKRDLVKRKGVFPYDWFDSMDKLEETKLPPHAAFYSRLRGNNISDEEYRHAQQVWDTFGFSKFRQYHDLYCQTDTVLLADVFENYRRFCLSKFKIDPAHKFTAAGVSWIAMLKRTAIKFDLITDPNMMLMIQRGIRGGICSVLHRRFARANNPHVPGYDPSKPTTWIIYVDANNLYGWAMMESLPYGHFVWMTREECDRVQDELEEYVDPDHPYCYILEVDLYYPDELHKHHSDYPLAAENVVLDESMLPRHLMYMMNDCGTAQYGHGARKLLPTLWPRTRYVVHARNLHLYIKLGMKLITVRRGMRGRQSRWLKTWIDFNTAARAVATDESTKRFHKDANNIIYGKMTEDKTHHMDGKLATERDQVLRLVAQPNFKRLIEYNEHVSGIELAKSVVKMDRPTYGGFAVLELSKLLMIRYRYEELMPRYGKRCRILYSDTDSFIMEIRTPDFYDDVRRDLDEKGKRSWYDTSNYPRDGTKLHSELFEDFNMATPGKMKDEMGGVVIEEFVGIRPKEYSVKAVDPGLNKVKHKGVAKDASINHETFVRVLRGEITDHRSVSLKIQSKKHRLFTNRLTKKGLDMHDTKRVALNKKDKTLPYGHCKLNSEKYCRENLLWQPDPDWRPPPLAPSPVNNNDDDDEDVDDSGVDDPPSDFEHSADNNDDDDDDDGDGDYDNACPFIIYEASVQ
ncbi:MAG TPA: DNA polymerase [Pyrinomonadaceae bacterium]|nr:DNA polymerase [Pyrinomonadaceae bacterium]